MAHGDQPSNDTIFSIRTNARGFFEGNCDGHISINDLKIGIQKKEPNTKIHEYLSKQIPDYPTPVEFRISKVTHVTNNWGLQNIWQSEGFKACGSNNDKFSWWSLNIDEDSIKEAEELYLEKTFPDRTEEERERQVAFLSKFTTSPAFNLGKSRYGNFRFTLPLNELMETYSNQMCEGKVPVLREFKTTFYKQEIMYVVLIHSPELNEKFRNFPEIESSLFVDYKDNKIIWKAQAICNDFKFRLFHNKEDKIAETESFPGPYYVWDHVALAFHFDGVLQFPKEKLKESISYCEIDKINLSGNDVVTPEQAEKILSTLKE